VTRRLIPFLFVAILVGPSATRVAADGKIRAGNVVAQAGLTVVGAAIHGKIHGFGDLLRCLWSGSASGYGLYEAKSLAGKGHVQTGWIVANLAGSLSENAAAGRHPLAQLGYSIGPARVRVSVIPFDKQSDSLIHLDVSAFETLAFAVAVAENDRMQLRSGMIAFRRDTPYPFAEEAAGATSGMFPSTRDSDTITWSHEVIHAVQSLQLDVVEPFGFPRVTRRPPGTPRRMVRFEQVKLGVLNVASRFILSTQPYHRRWVEIEAYRLGLDTTPPEF